MLITGGLAVGAVGLATLSAVTSVLSSGITTFLWLIVATLGALCAVGWSIGWIVSLSRPPTTD